ncbi:MAG TPA: hypothetical protein VI731_04220, partial [Bacteroidia bacterium]|nr:hypothetical protein [Bacteroidia bacterium]
MKTGKLSLLFFSVSAILFLLLLVTLAYHARPASNDFSFIGLLQDNNYFGALEYIWNNSTGRWSSVMLANLTLNDGEHFQSLHGHIFIHYLLLFVILITSAFTILRRVLLIYYNEVPGKFMLLTWSVLFCALFYFTTFSAQEAWMWFSGSTVHLAGITATLAGTAFLLSPRISFLTITSIAVCFLFTGGALETWAIFLAGILIFTLILISRNIEKKQFITNPHVRKIIIALSFLLVSFSFNILSPGSKSRIDTEKQITAENLSGTQRHNFPIDKKHFFAILLLAPWFYFGEQMRKKENSEKKLLLVNKNIHMLIISGLILFCAVTLLIMYIIFKGPGPLRAWTGLSLLLSITLAYAAFEAGKRIKMHDLILAGSGIMICAGMGYCLVHQFQLTNKFSIAYDQ